MMRLGLVRRVNRLCADRNRPRQKVDDGAGKDIVPVTGHHVAGIGHIDEFRAGTQLQKLAGAFLAEDV